MIRLQANTLSISGDLTMAQLEQAYKALPADCERVEQVDLSEVSAMDSGGVAFLLTLQQRLAKPLCLLGLTDQARVLVDLYNLGQMFTFKKVSS